MTEIANRPTTDMEATPVGLPATDSVVQLQEWAAELSAARQLASVLASSSFLPLALRKKGKDSWKNVEELTYDAAAVILAGKSVGLDPMQSVQNIFPVHGMPSMYARTMVALVIAQGHEVKRSAATDDSVTYSVRRKGSEEWQDFTWTIDRAKKAGYTSNSKYQSDPIAMLGAKAAAEACRTVFPDILLGMAYSAEEIELEDMGENPETTQAGGSAASRLAAVAAKQEPEPQRQDVTPLTSPTPVTEDVLPAPTEEPKCSRSQQTKLGNALKANGHTTKEEMLRITSTWVGREVASSADLTVSEANEFTKELEDAAAGQNTDGVIADEPAADADAAWLNGGDAA